MALDLSPVFEPPGFSFSPRSALIRAWRRCTLKPFGREQHGDHGEAARQQALHDLDVRGHEHAGPLVFLGASERAIQRQLRRVEGLNRFNM